MRGRDKLYLGLGLAIWITSAASCADSSSAVEPQRVADRARPNVLLLVISTVRPDRLSAYGYERPTSPNLERLARESVVYEHCISPGTWELPAEASLFTGLYVRDHRADGIHARDSTLRGRRALSDDRTLLAERLRESGYETGGLSNDSWLDSHFGMQQGFDSFTAMYPRDPRGDWGDEGARVSNELALAWLDQRDANRPFFFYMNYLEPAMPYAPPEPFGSRSLAEGTDPAAVEELRAWRYPREMAYMLDVPGGEVSEEQFEILSRLYEGELAYVDFRLGELLAGLDERGLSESTVLIVTSDHGEHLGEHGLMHHKGSVYEPLIRVPLFLRYPPLAPKRVRSLVQTHDLYPTILDLCGIPGAAPAGSLRLPFSEGDPTREYAFAEAADPSPFFESLRSRFPGTDFSRFGRALRTVRGTRYKYIWGSDGTRELYDLSEDPSENVDLSRQLPGVAARLHEVLLRFDRRELP